MTLIVISGGEQGWVQALVKALEKGAGGASMDDETLISLSSDGGGISLSWALFGAHPFGDRMVRERQCAKAQVCRTMVGAIDRGVRVFHGDLGHLMRRYPVALFRVLVAGGGEDRKWERRRRRLFGRRFLGHDLYDMYLPGGVTPAADAARAILERSAVAFGDPGCPLSRERLGLAHDMAAAELDLVRRGLDVEFWDVSGRVTVWNRSELENGALEERVRRLYGMGAVSCRRGTPPELFEARLPYTIRLRVEGEQGLGEAVAAVAARNGGRTATTAGEVVLFGGLGWGGRLLVDLPETLVDPEEVVWRLRALYPGRGLVLPAPRYAWLVARMGLETGAARLALGETT